MSSPFDKFFEKATGASPFPFQRAFAENKALPSLVDVSTGLGKTAMAIVGWLWRRLGAPDEVRRQTPRRLVYCLPMRVLVEQTRDNAIRWLHNLGRLGGEVTFDLPRSAGQSATPDRRIATYTPRTDQPEKVAVYVLMGGEDEEVWDMYPEREAIIIGTQDMLLSRALNRGYAARRSRWPMKFGLLNTDCLWVFDEIQLMGSGLATTAQLEAFRRLLPRGDAETATNGQGCRSVWMSATLRPEWLRTVDFKSRIDDQGRIGVQDPPSLPDNHHTDKQVSDRWNAKKPLTKAKAAMAEHADTKALVPLADEIRQAHKSGTRTIVVVNSVARACALYEALKKGFDGASRPVAASGKRSRRRRNEAVPAQPNAGTNAPKPNLVLLHSRFRPDDRAKRVTEALADVPADGPGTIIVSTQVIEAGVDVSAATLFTELAPWESLVQRFGRCNRRGEQNEQACVKWIDLPANDEEAEKLRFPYELSDLRAAAEELEKLTDVGLASLAAHQRNLTKDQQNVLLPHEHTHVIRRRDLIDLFDTTPDLAGNDIDIDRFVREVEDSDVRVFWRDYGDPERGATPNRIGGEDEDVDKSRAEPAPRRKELCPAPIGEFRDFAKGNRRHVWRWNFLDKKWDRLTKEDADTIAPGQVYLLHAASGGYSSENGWDPQSTTRVEPIPPEPGEPNIAPDATDDDAPSQIGVWQSIEEHTNDVCNELEAIVRALPLDEQQLAGLRAAARWHDRGKAHAVFQNAVDDGQTVLRPRGAVTRRSRPERWKGSRVIAKAPGKQWTNGRFADAGWWRKYDWPDGGRKHFRHELPSALAVLQRPHDTLSVLSDEDLNLVAYLVAAHHGKVRLSIRSLPDEKRPGDGEGDRASQRRFARGVWDGDVLPATDLGGGVTAPEVTLSLEPMELGLCEQPPFAGQPSWAERMIRLRDTLGPFRLAYLEAILRAADMRASANAEKRGTTR